VRGEGVKSCRSRIAVNHLTKDTKHIGIYQ